MRHPLGVQRPRGRRQLPCWELCNLSKGVDYPIIHVYEGHLVLVNPAFPDIPSLHWCWHWSWNNRYILLYVLVVPTIWEGWGVAASKFTFLAIFKIMTLTNVGTKRFQYCTMTSPQTSHNIHAMLSQLCGSTKIYVTFYNIATMSCNVARIYVNIVILRLFATFEMM